jgi:hypothetical protein
MRNDYHYSVFLSKDHNGVLRLVAVQDLLTAPAALSSKIRIVNLSDTYNSDAQAVSLDFTVSDLVDTTRFENLNYLSITAFTPIVAGAHYWNINYADSSLSVLGKNESSFTVLDGKLTSYIVYGNALKSDSFKLVEFKHN